jgi:4-amino-4-deoxy-L-arabinose transferase-like glycosyltransferase
LSLGLVLYVPSAGAFSLLDPWEPHYGEVAREMLARDDWLSLWWAQDGWFWSKPVLDFWLQGLSFSALGVSFEPGQMLAGAAHGYLPQPEWAARMPIVLLSLLSSYVLYRWVANAAGRLAGF